MAGKPWTLKSGVGWLERSLIEVYSYGLTHPSEVHHLSLVE